MKVANKNGSKKDKVKKKGGVNKPKPKKEQVLVVAQEIKYARWLSGNDKKTRDRVLKALKKWILNCIQKGYEFKEEDFTRVWKGLFYAVWMSDKPLVQEELCENIAGILDLFPPEHLEHALLMTKAGLKILATEWYGIDQHRMDKFLMLVRRYLRGSLRCLARCEWSLDSCHKYAKMLSGTDGVFAIQTPHYARNATSMLLHITDCFLEELSKVSRGAIDPAPVGALLAPFVRYMCLGGGALVRAAARRLLTALLRQTDLGLRYEDKTRAWKQMGCPPGGPDALEPASEDDDVENGGAASDEDDTSGPLDPRAGRVDVMLAPLPAPASMLASMLRGMLASAPPAAHRRIRICLERFEKLSQGQYPLPVTVESEPAPETGAKPRRAARALQQFDMKLRVDADELKLRGLSRKHKKRLLRKSRAGLSIVEDVEEYKKALSKRSNNGEWVVETTETESGKTEKDTSNKENQDKGKKNNKPNAQKRKNDSTLQNGEANNKKRKLDKANKNNTVNNENKNKKLLNNENKNKKLVNNVNKKNDLVSNKSPSKNEKNNKLKQTKSQNKVTELLLKATPKQKDVKETANEPKTDGAKDAKTKKPKSQPEITSKPNKTEVNKKTEAKPKLNKKDKPSFLVNKVKNFQKQLPIKDKKEKKDSTPSNDYDTPKKVKFELKKNSMQKPVDYYKSVRQSPSIPFDSSKKPSKTNLKPSTPSPINPFFKKKLRMKH